MLLFAPKNLPVAESEGSFGKPTQPAVYQCSAGAVTLREYTQLVP